MISVTNYSSRLSVRETQKAIKFVKDEFQKRLSESLCLDRVSAPVFVPKKSGVNDDLNGVERKVHFTAKELGEEPLEVVQSLAKWKRSALHSYGFQPGEGLYTDMNAIRRDDDTDNLHSIFVDQWDWEAVITEQQRTVDFLKEAVKKIVAAVADTADSVRRAFPAVCPEIEREICFITTQELEDRYPELSPKERENMIVREKKTVFLMQIGGKLKSGQKHDGRAPDYDDWSLNGDILFYNPLLNCAFEVSSMGIRVDSASLLSQLKEAGAEDRLCYPYHKAVAEGTLPLTVGGGIGQSRLCMLFLEKAHIGEVQVSIWPDEMREVCEKAGIVLL